MDSTAGLRRILLATERTEHDAGAERIALLLAQRLGAALDVAVPLVENADVVAATPDLALRAEEQAEAALAHLRGQAADAGLALRAAVHTGESAGRILLDAARHSGADLLVTRRVGRRGLLARLLVGEMVSEVAAGSPCPVLMVPQAAQMLWSGRLRCRGPAAAAAHPVAAALAALGARPVPVDEAGAGAAGDADPADLLVVALDADAIHGGRLARPVEALVGAAPCPALLVRVPL